MGSLVRRPLLSQVSVSRTGQGSNNPGREKSGVIIKLTVMANKLFIEDYHIHRDKNILEVWVGMGTKVQQINITLFGYEIWLDQMGKLEYVTDYAQEGEHGQDAGSYTVEDYWQLSSKDITPDILLYVKTHPICEGEKVIAENPVSFLKERLKAA
jgi:hypothetical protein